MTIEHDPSSKSDGEIKTWIANHQRLGVTDTPLFRALGLKMALSAKAQDATGQGLVVVDSLDVKGKLELDSLRRNLRPSEGGGGPSDRAALTRVTGGGMGVPLLRGAFRMGSHFEIRGGLVSI